jgi:very-short-patch-repair endonuclease
VLTPSDIETAIEAVAGRSGIGPVRAALAQADARVESVGETVTGYVIRALGFEVEPQYEVLVEGRRFRADFRLKGTRVLLEFDGRVKYAEGDRSVLFEEKRREDALRRAGWVVVRLVWSDLHDPTLVRRRIRAALSTADA